MALGASHGIGGSPPTISDFFGKVLIQMHWSWLFFIPPIIVALLFSNHAGQYKETAKQAKVVLSLFMAFASLLEQHYKYSTLTKIGQMP